MGKTHTVEVHPDLDHLYRAKGYIKDSGKDAMHISAFKKNESFNHITNKLPKDTKGFVTPEGIDKHIESLPKHKVDIRVLDAYNRPQEQKHRKNATEYTLSMNMHPETKAKMSNKQLGQWNAIKLHQHSWEPQDENSLTMGNNISLKDKDQIGWVRIDPHKSYGQDKEKIGDTNDGEIEHPHWHLDEIQSDFQNHRKIKYLPGMQTHDSEIAKSHPDWEKTNNELQSAAQADPNHPLAKLWQDADDGTHPLTQRWREERDDQIHELVAPHAQKIMQEKYPELNTPDGADPVDMTPEQEDEYQNLIEDATSGVLADPDHPLYQQANDIWENDLDPGNDAKHEILDDAIAEHIKSKDPEFFKKSNVDINKMLELLSCDHDDPQHMLHSAVNALARKLNIKSTSMDTPEDQAKKSNLQLTDMSKLPVHQIDTYNKRPKKLGMQLIDKASLLGDGGSEDAKDIQYARLHKRLKILYAQLEKLKKVT